MLSPLGNKFLASVPQATLVSSLFGIYSIWHFVSKTLIILGGFTSVKAQDSIQCHKKGEH